MIRSTLCLFMLATAATAAPSIIPQPVELNERGGSLQLGADTVITYVDANAKASAELLAAQLRPSTGFKLPVQQGTDGTIVLAIGTDHTLGEEGYALTVDVAVEITAPTARGLFYGTQTLRQLLPPEIYNANTMTQDWILPKVSIRDQPRFGWRGLMLDVSRHFMSKEEVMKFIDTMASLKYNTFHWHLTDDQGWRIEIKKYPRLTEVGAWREETLIGHLLVKPNMYDGTRHGGYYTQDEIREVVAYAAARHITIVPEIDMPGHMQSAIAAYPELGCTTNQLAVKTGWGISKNILNPEDSTVQFCKDVLTEVMELFPSEFIHIGGDEANKEQWEASERIQQLREERGLSDMHEMQSWFIKQMDDFLVKNGRRLIGWDEISEGGLAENAAVMWWRGTGALNIIQQATEEGHDLVVASREYLYFDYYQGPRDTEPLATGAIVPLEKVYGFDPIIKELSEQAASHVLGAQGQIWTEYIPTMKQAEYMAFPRACALAELVWLPNEQKDFADFENRLKTQFKRFDNQGVYYRR